VATGRQPDLAIAQASARAELELLGLVAMADPPRVEVAGAISAATAAGIRTVMVTGDDPTTARAIATRLGLVDGGVITGPELAALPDAELAGRLADVSVFARTSPEQ
jgi:Ca2+-transporting ATPase